MLGNYLEIFRIISSSPSLALRIRIGERETASSFALVFIICGMKNMFDKK